MNEYLVPILMFVALLVGVFTGFPLGFVIGGIGLFTGLIFWGPAYFQLAAVRFWGLVGAGETAYVLAAAPLFIYMGILLERSGIADRLYEAMHQLMGPVRGGLALGTVIIGTILAAATGVIGASIVAIGLIALPSMLRRGYNKELAAGTIMASGTLAIIIPPSIMLVFYGPMAQLSVGKLMMGAFIPGFVLSGLYMAYIATRCYLQPELAPPLPPEERGLPIGRKLRMLITSLIPPLGLIFAVLGTIFLGIAPPTEAAAFGALGSLILAVIYGKLSWGILYDSVKQLIAIGGMLAIVFAGASIFTAAFLGLGGAEMATELLTALPIGRWGVLILMMLVVFALGFLVDWIGIILIIVPTFTPIVARLGFDPLWFGILVCVNLQMSFLTPPFAPAIFYMKAIVPREVTTGHLVRGVVPFILLQAIGLALVLAFPQLALWLPSKMIK